MKTKLLVFTFLFITKAAFCQLIPIDAAGLKKIIDTNRTNIIYFNAAWCQPCMEKTALIYQQRDSSLKKFNVIIINDKLGFDENYFSSHYPKERTFYLMNSKYYTSRGIIQINSENKAFKNLAEDLRQTLNYKIPPKFLLFGSAMITKGDKAELFDGSRGKPKESFTQLIEKAGTF